MAVHQPSSFLHNFVDRDKVKVHKNRKSNQVNNQPSLLNKFGQQGIYYIAKHFAFITIKNDLLISRAREGS